MAKRREQERDIQRQQARDTGMECFETARILSTSMHQMLGDPLQRSTFVLEVTIHPGFLP